MGIIFTFSSFFLKKVLSVSKFLLLLQCQNKTITIKTFTIMTQFNSNLIIALFECGFTKNTDKWCSAIATKQVTPNVLLRFDELCADRHLYDISAIEGTDYSSRCLLSGDMTIEQMIANIRKSINELLVLPHK